MNAFNKVGSRTERVQQLRHRNLNAFDSSGLFDQAKRPSSSSQGMTAFSSPTGIDAASETDLPQPAAAEFPDDATVNRRPRVAERRGPMGVTA
jgi:hypothetical protein